MKYLFKYIQVYETLKTESRYGDFVDLVQKRHWRTETKSSWVRYTKHNQKWVEEICQWKSFRILPTCLQHFMTCSSYGNNPLQIHWRKMFKNNVKDPVSHA